LIPGLQPNGKIVKLSYYSLRTAQWLGSHVAILFLMWSLWLAFEYFAFGPASYVRIHDNGDSQLASKLALVPTLTDGQFGYWESQKVSGADTLAGGGGAPVELDSLFFALLPGWLAYGLIMWLQRFVAGYFTFRLLKESLNLDTLPALYAGLAYSLFAQETINVSWAGFTLYDGLTLPGLPFVLWAMTRMNAVRRYRSYLFAAGLGIIYSLTSSYAFTVFVIPLVFFWFFFVTPILRPTFWVIPVLFTVAWLLSELPILWASFLNAPLSHRADWVLNSPLHRGWTDRVSFVHGLVRDNALPLGLASVGLVVSCGRDRRLVSLAGAVIFALGFVVSYPFLKMMVDTYLGFLSGFQFVRLYLIVPFLAIVSGGVALHLIESHWRLPLTKQTSYHYGLSVQTLLFVVAIVLIAWQSLVHLLR
jgi:hypothetical protein